MKEKTILKEFVEEYNDDNIDESSVEITTTRVKVFLVNSKGEVLVATSGGGCQFPGGHIEQGENIFQCAIREVEEETGIILDYNEIQGQFYKTKYLIKNHQNTGKNKLSETIYLLAKTDKKTNFANINLTSEEKANNFNVTCIKLENFKDYVKAFINPKQKEIYILIAKEMLRVFTHLKKTINI